jgi:hypothetical protein
VLAIAQMSDDVFLHAQRFGDRRQDELRLPDRRKLDERRTVPERVDEL